jgi:hypothetical protein
MDDWYVVTAPVLCGPVCAWLTAQSSQLATVTGQAGDVCRIWQLPKEGKPKELKTITPPGMNM